MFDRALHKEFLESEKNVGETDPGGFNNNVTEKQMFGERARPDGRCPIPRMQLVAFNLSDFGAVGDGAAVNTETFERAVVEIGKLARRGGGQFNVQPGCWLTYDAIS